ncbi:hypothetical protein [Sphingomonas sp.]|uniref:hypothetical protein n=1 Tax=Sphingomonas sp. TaxID=28214 RepID=UPI0028A12142|nr:hypothetical protein [Sphingomonas sp.]
MTTTSFEVASSDGVCVIEAACAFSRSAFLRLSLFADSASLVLVTVCPDCAATGMAQAIAIPLAAIKKAKLFISSPLFDG